MKKIIFSIAILSATFQYTFSQSVDSAEAKIWAEYITDPDIYIGVFNNSAPPDLAALDNGNFAEEDPNFTSIALNHFILKLDTKEKLKGDFDNAIFVQNTTFNQETNISVQFLPFMRTTMLLGMRNVLKTICVLNGLVPGLSMFHS